MSGIKFGDFLEAGNGLWAILALWLAVFLVFHILVVRVQRKVNWARFFFKLPLSMQLAMGLLGAAGAVFMTRAVLWWSRYKHAGDLDLLMPEVWVYGAGIGLGIVSFLCILRTVSHPAFGHWPWLAALASCFVYGGWWVARLW